MSTQNEREELLGSASDKPFDLAPPQKGHPRGLYLLFFTEMWERFSYYGMRAILILFLTKQLFFEKSFATNGIFGSFTGLVYLTPIIGGYIADRYWGNRRSILVGGLMMAIGQFLLFFSGSIENLDVAKALLYSGLGFLIFGNGFFKPNISTMVGQLYPENDSRLDGAYTIFYMGINLGAFFSPLICGYLGENIDFKWGFLAAGLGMVVSTISFELLKNKVLVSPTGQQIGMKPAKAPITEAATTKSAAFSPAQYGVLLGGGVALYFIFNLLLGFDFFGSLIFSLALAIPTSIIIDKSLSRVEKQRIAVIYVAAFFVVFFWSAFEQAGSSLTFFADEQTNRHVFGWEMPASWFNSFNAVFIVILAPLFSWFWIKLNKVGREPSAPRKQALGLLLLALGYLWIAVGVKGLQPGVKSSMVLLTVLYLIHTMGELCLSPIGLSMVNKLSPMRFASLLMGVWFLANATANKFAGILGAYYPEEQSKVASYPVNNANIMLADGKTLNWNDVVVERTAAPQGYSWEAVKVKKSATSKEEDSVTSLKVVPQGNYAVLTDTFKARHTYPDPLKKVEIKKLAQRGEIEPKFKGFLLAGGKQFGLLRQGKESSAFEVWDLYPQPKKFMGFTIATLYDFFMIFVVMAGIASLLLFALSGKLRKMMSGVR